MNLYSQVLVGSEFTCVCSLVVDESEHGGRNVDREDVVPAEMELSEQDDEGRRWDLRVLD